MPKEHATIVQDIANALLENHVLDNGAITSSAEIEKMALENEGQTMDNVKGVHAARTSIMAGAALAMKEIGLKAHQADADLESVSFSQKFGSDNCELSLARSASYRNPKDRDGAPIVKAGVLDARYIARGTSKKSGALKVIQAEINDAWKTLL